MTSISAGTSYYEIRCEDFYAVGLEAKDRREGVNGCCNSCHNEMADGDFWAGHEASPPEKDRYGWRDAPEVIVCCGVQKPRDRSVWAKVLRAMRTRVRVAVKEES